MERDSERSERRQTNKKAFDHKFSLIIIGDQNVGKTSLVRFFRNPHDRFIEYLQSTICIDFCHRDYEIEGKNIKVQLWDTPGQDKFKTITRTHYKRGDLILIAYDVGSKRSFDSLHTWI